jgi:hypothetical protein
LPEGDFLLCPAKGVHSKEILFLPSFISGKEEDFFGEKDRYNCPLFLLPNLVSLCFVDALIGFCATFTACASKTGRYAQAFSRLQTLRAYFHGPRLRVEFLLVR